MAGHAFENCSPAYVDGIKTGDRTEFPGTPAFANGVAPSRFQGDIEELEVFGNMPKSIHGTYYSMGVDKRFPPMHEDDILFNGDGIVGAYYIADGHVDWKRRYVKNDRYKAESKAHRSLFGRYRNPYTDDPSVKGLIRTTSNTNIVFWRGVMLACKEDGPPYALDPETLETIGRYDFDGQVVSPTFTAHPKIDPETGNMLCFGYEAGGNGNDCSREIVFYEIGADGKKITEVWFEAPFCGYIHDFGFTKNHIILPMTPLKADIQRLQKSKVHWAWDPNEDHFFGVAPRRGPRREDMVWLRSDNCFQGHVAGAYESGGGDLVFDLSMADGNVFFWFPEDGKPPVPPGPGSPLRSPMTRYTFPVGKDGRLVSPEGRIAPARSCQTSVEFSRIDDRFQGKEYTQFWALGMDGTRPYDVAQCGPPAGGLFNLLVHFNWSTGSEEVWWPGPTTTLQEPCFVPRDVDGSPEGEGHIVVVLNRLDRGINELAVLDAQKVGDGPVSLVRLPLRPRLAFHGNFVDHRDIERFEMEKEKLKAKGPPAPLPWQQKGL